MSRPYPIYLNIENSPCIVVGGGPVAERKVTGLLEAGARVTVVSPKCTATLNRLADSGAITIVAREYSSGDDVLLIDGARLVFAATSSRTVNGIVAADAHARRVPVNVADAPDSGNFSVPAVVRRADFCLAISTGGANPMLSAHIADELDRRYGPEYGPYVELLGEMRAYIKERASASHVRRSALAAIIDLDAQLRALIIDGDMDASRDLARRIADTVIADIAIGNKRFMPALPAE